MRRGQISDATKAVAAHVGGATQKMMVSEKNSVGLNRLMPKEDSNSRVASGQMLREGHSQ